MMLKKFFWFFPLSLILFVHGFSGNPMTFSSIAQSLSMISGKINVDEYAGNSNDLSYFNGHYYTGIRPSHSLIYLPSALFVKWISGISFIDRGINLMDNLFVNNPKLPPPRDPGLFIAINFITVISFIFLVTLIIYKNFSPYMTNRIFLVYLFTPALALASGLYIQSFALLGLTFLAVAVIYDNSLFYIYSACFLGISDYTWLPLSAMILFLNKKSIRPTLPVIILSTFLIFDGIFHWQVFKSPWLTPYSFRFSNPAIHGKGFMGLDVLNIFSGFWNRMTSLTEGIIYYNPDVIIFSLISQYVVIRSFFSRKAKVIFIITLYWFWFVTLSFVDPVSGIPGNRYVIPLLPLVILPVLNFQRQHIYNLSIVLLMIRGFWNWHVIASAGNVNTAISGYISTLLRYPPVFIIAKYWQAGLPNIFLVTILGWFIFIGFVYSLKKYIIRM